MTAVEVAKHARHDGAYPIGRMGESSWNMDKRNTASAEASKDATCGKRRDEDL